MKRLDLIDIVPLLGCLECGKGDIVQDATGLVCSSCNYRIPTCRDIPVMMRVDNALFPPHAYADDSGGRPPAHARSGWKAAIKSKIPGRSLNIARDRMFGEISASHHAKGKLILVIGCGNQEDQLDHFFPGETTQFVFCDVDKGASADVFCDGHALPFKPALFDGVISTAVMEHVLEPPVVAAQMHRVLKTGGFVYSEIPFLQGVHEGAYDFTRFTLGGHRALYGRFTEIDAGMVAGPGTNLVWQLTDFFRYLSPNPKISGVLGMTARVLFGWIKYTDHIFKNNPKAVDAASCTYFYGTRHDGDVDAAQIIARYGTSAFSHT